MGEFVVCCKGFQRFNPRPARNHLHAFQVRGMHADEQAFYARIRVNADQGPSILGRIALLFLRHKPPDILTAEFPAMNDLNAIQRLLLRIRQGCICGLHIGEYGIAAIGRKRLGMQDCGK